jgi:general secretion pathway protein M
MDMIEGIKGRWSDLQPREQKVLRFGGAVFGLVLVYALIIEPVYSARDEARQNLQATRQALAEMRQQAADLKAMGVNAGGPASGSLLTLVERSIGEQGLRDALDRLQPNGNDQIQVSLDGATYSQLMQWLTGLHGQGVRAQRVDIRVDRDSDLLEVQLLLAR